MRGFKGSLSTRQLMRMGSKQERQAIADRVRAEGIRLRCEVDSYVMRAYHSEWHGSYWKCKNGHRADWDDVLQQLVERGFEF